MRTAMKTVFMIAALFPVQGVLGQEGLNEVLVEIGDKEIVVDPFEITVGEIENMVIYSSDGNRVGEIKEVLGTPSGEISAVVVDVGGYLGIGQRRAIIPLGMVTPDGLRLTIEMSPEQVNALTEWQG